MRGATQYFTRQDLTNTVSIHAPMRGATAAGKTRCKECAGFNPRAHAGRDMQWTADEDKYLVSIHAPMRGATQNYLMMKT